MASENEQVCREERVHELCSDSDAMGAPVDLLVDYVVVVVVLVMRVVRHHLNPEGHHFGLSNF